MGVLVSKFNHIYKQPHKGENEPPKKDTKEESAITIEPRSLTSIYYDCLERILDRLDLQDLLNVAQTCKRLQIAAAANFSDRYGKTAVVLIPKNTTNDFKGLRRDANHIYAFGMESCLPFLRCFGAKISDLHIIHTTMHAHYNIVDYYVNQYCADTLSSIEYVSRGQEFSSESFVKPFERVEIAIIMYCNLKQLPNFVQWFPNLRHLEIDDLSIHNSIPTCLPTLEYLSIDFTYGFMEECVESFLHENKQLQTIELAIGYNVEIEMSELLGMISGNTSITSLVRYNYDAKNQISHANEDELLELASKHPGIIELDLHDCLLNVDDAIRFFRQMKSLIWFRFRIKNRAAYDDLLKKLDTNWKHEHWLDGNDTAQYIVAFKKEIKPILD